MSESALRRAVAAAIESLLLHSTDRNRTLNEAAESILEMSKLVESDHEDASILAIVKEEIEKARQH